MDLKFIIFMIDAKQKKTGYETGSAYSTNISKCLAAMSIVFYSLCAVFKDNTGWALIILLWLQVDSSGTFSTCLFVRNRQKKNYKQEL